MTLLDPPAARMSLRSDGTDLELTADELAEEVIRVIANADRADFARGPYVYSISVVERGRDGAPADPTAVYHYELYGKDDAVVRELLSPLAKDGAKLDVSVRRSSSHPAEHKLVSIRDRRS